MQNEQLRLEVLRLVMTVGSENDRRDPIAKAGALLKWITAEVEQKSKAAPKRKAGE